MADVSTRTVDSPLGPITVAATALGVRAIAFTDGEDTDGPGVTHAVRAVEQLRAYVEGARTEFELPLDLPATPFQRLVWDELCRIPCGETRSYAWIAGKVGKPNGVRAVGRANGQNRVAIIVPCHRVIASDGTLCGYGGKLWRKEELLRLEGAGLFTGAR